MWAASAFVLSLLWKGFFCQVYTIQVPNQFPVQRGLCALVPCTFTYDMSMTTKNPLGLWFRKFESWPCWGMAVASNPQRNEVCAQTRGRFWLVGDPWKSECSLRIDDVRDSDKGEYYFRYENSQVKYSYLYYYQLLDVQVQELTDKPDVTLPDGIIEGQHVTVNCTPPGRCLGTPPTIQWKVEFTSTYHEHLYLIDYYNGTTFNVSSITFNASRQDHRKYLRCTATFPAVGVSTTRESLLIIQYPPLVPEINVFKTDKDAAEGTHNTSSVFIREGINITLHCAVDSNPTSNLTWLKGEKVLNISDLSSNNTLALNIININSSQDGGVYRCQAIHKLGNETSSITINVQYPPRIPNIDIEMVLPSDETGLEKNDSTANVLENKTLTMACAVDSVPTANLSWIKGGEKEILKTSVNQSSLTLTLRSIKPDQDGQYWCVAANELGTANASLLINVEYAPKFVARYNTSCHKEYNNVTCVCVVMANPLPAIQWKINATTLPEALMNGTVVQLSAMENHTRTSILWLNISEGKSLSVSCQFSNKHGRGSFIMLGAVTDGNAPAAFLLPMIGGVLAGVVFVAAMFMLGWLLIRKDRRMKNDNTSGSNKQEMVDDDTPIYSQVFEAPKSPIRVSNDGAKHPPSSGGDATVPTENMHGSPSEEDLQYASIDFSKLKSRNSPIQPTEETIYAGVKVK